MPVVVMTGLRQTGKSTLLQRDPSLRDREFVSLDEFAQLQAARHDPETFLRRDAPVSIDEAQRCPELFLEIRRAVDQDRRPGRFLLSGSANFALLRGVARAWPGARWEGRDLPELRAFLQRSPRCRVAILAHTGTATVSLGERLWAMPIAALLN